MVEGALNAAAELVIEKTAYGNHLERDGNRSPHVAPQGLYPGAADETWLALSVGDRRAVGFAASRCSAIRSGRVIRRWRRSTAVERVTTSST